MRYSTKGFVKSHWIFNGKTGSISKGQGLAVIGGTQIVVCNAMTIGQPHSHREGWEEVWLVLEGINLVFLGREISWQYPGMAYRIPPDNNTPHSNINTTEEPVKYLIYITRKRN